MNLDFKDQIWKGGFRPTLEAEAFEDKLRAKLGLTAKYESRGFRLDGRWP